ncbi:MAG TPA: Crp/Fnr family transcriptional regulator [Roseiflexaceae bacterium]|nr:Crp/Fnr family transcriptional regulator [Roseiflexaceae bacterium]
METHRTILQRVSFCAGLPDATIAALARIAALRERTTGSIIQIEGEPAEAMYIVARGRVKISRISHQGREQVLNVIEPGGHFNTVPIFDGGPCPANAEALTDVMLLALPRDPLLRVAEENAVLALALLREFTGRLRHLVNLIDELSLHTVQGRLAGLLIAQAKAAERGEATPPLTQAEMAARLGTVREMVARTLKSFEALGLISLERGVITIHDRAGLVKMREE